MRCGSRRATAPRRCAMSAIAASQVAGSTCPAPLGPPRRRRPVSRSGSYPRPRERDTFWPNPPLLCGCSWSPPPFSASRSRPSPPLGSWFGGVCRSHRASWRGGLPDTPAGPGAWPVLRREFAWRRRREPGPGRREGRCRRAHGRRPGKGAGRSSGNQRVFSVGLRRWASASVLRSAACNRGTNCSISVGNQRIFRSRWSRLLGCSVRSPARKAQLVGRV